jgi:hypothetical protein
VGRTWRFVTDDGHACVDIDYEGLRSRLGVLKGTSAPASFGLPWPPAPAKNWFWRYMIGNGYHNAPLDLLRGALPPLRWSGTLPAVDNGGPPVQIEALRHPFAVTTLAHLSLEPAVPWSSATDAGDRLYRLLAGPLADANQVRDGFPIELLPGLPSRELEGDPARFVQSGEFQMISALHDEPDPAGVASSLALKYDGVPNPAVAHPLKQGCICVAGTVVGFVLPSRGLVRVEQKHPCLHRNLTTLLSYLQNLMALTPARPTASCQPFQDRAAKMLNHFYRRTPPKPQNTIYRSRLAQLWIDQIGLSPEINALTPDLPALPVP